MKDKELRTMLHEHQKKENERYDKMKKKADKFEKVACNAIYGGIVIGLMGIVLTISIDVIRTQPPIMGWLQKTGIIVFLGIFTLSAALLAMLKEKDDTDMRGGSFKKMASK